MMAKMADSKDCVAFEFANKCKRCNKTAQSGYKCIRCGTTSHPSCVTYLKNVIIISESEKLVNCCDNSDDPDVLDLSFCSAKGENNMESHSSELFYLKYVIKQKNQIIKQQQDLIEAYKQQIVLLNKQTMCGTHSEIVAPSAAVKFNNSKDVNSIKARNKLNKEESLQTSVHTVNASMDSSKNHQQSASVAVVNQTMSKTKMKTKQINNNNPKTLSPTEPNSTIVNNDIQNDNKFTGKIPDKSGRHHGKYIVGALTENGVKTIDKNAYLHVFKTHPDLTTDELKTLLVTRFPEVIVEKLNSKHPLKYSSFKITINFDNLEHAMKPDVWPRGAWVNRFFHGKKSPIGSS